MLNSKELTDVPYLRAIEFIKEKLENVFEYEEY